MSTPKSLKDYNLLRLFVESGKNKIERKIANNTYAKINDNENKIDILYHGNLIIEMYLDRVILHDAGYRTFTTKERLNWFLPLGVNLYQKNYNWYISNNWGMAPFIYQDGVIVYTDKHIENAAKDTSKEKSKLIKQVNQYCNDYMTELIAGNVPAPSNGDCWGCLFIDVETGKTVMGNDHLLSHIEEKYYVPSLLTRAVKIFPVSIIARSVIGNLWCANKQIDDCFKDIVFEQGKSSLKRYMLRELNIA